MLTKSPKLMIPLKYTNKPFLNYIIVDSLNIFESIRFDEPTVATKRRCVITNKISFLTKQISEKSVPKIEQQLSLLHLYSSYANPIQIKNFNFVTFFCGCTLFEVDQIKSKKCGNLLCRLAQFRFKRNIKEKVLFRFGFIHTWTR